MTAWARTRHFLDRFSTLLMVATAGALLLFVFWDGLKEMAGQWSLAEFSHGYLIPPLALLIGAQRASRLKSLPLKASWGGFGLVLFGLAVFFIGELSTLYPLIEYAFLFTLTGLVVTAIGGRGTIVLAPALIYLAFMVPLPQFFYAGLSTKLQLLSTHLGLTIVRAFSIPVFAEGNVIDLGQYKLQVAEACSGLRYLFPLMSFSFLVAYLYRGPLWQKAVLFVSAVPIAILMNGLRIGMIGFTVDRYGVGAAEGFVHVFEGWTIFLICLVLLLGEALLLLRAGGAGGRLRDALVLDLPSGPVLGRLPRKRWARGQSTAMLACLVALGLAGWGAAPLKQRMERPPERKAFALFPLDLGDWRGQDVPLEAEILARLKPDDYLQTDYREKKTGALVNLFITYYAAQRAGAAAHSPHNCLPGGGWEIDSLRSVERPLSRGGDGPSKVNRAVIRKGPSRLLVYYWFRQRGRILTGEFDAKWYLLVDSILKERTDGAMIRLATPIYPDEPEENADARLSRLATRIQGLLGAYIPD